MSAADHLGVQFISLRELGGYASGDFGGAVKDVPAKMLAQNGGKPSGQLQKVSQSIGATGRIRQPLVVHDWGDGNYGPGRRELFNGHHRAVAAMEHGVDPVPVTIRRVGRT